jgi:Dimerisation and cyclophilin-binding domain of Mon2
MAALEADLRALSAESRRRHPAVKDAAEHAILKVSGIFHLTRHFVNTPSHLIFFQYCTLPCLQVQFGRSTIKFYVLVLDG